MAKDDKTEQKSNDINISGTYLMFLLERVMALAEEGGGVGLFTSQPISCAICNKPAAARTKLIGEYSTILCNEHTNEWHIYVNGSIELQSFESAQIRLDIAIRQENETVALGLAVGARKAKMALYELGKNWVESKARAIGVDEEKE